VGLSGHAGIVLRTSGRRPSRRRAEIANAVGRPGSPTAMRGTAAFHLSSQGASVMHAAGLFEVEVAPQAADHPAAKASGLARLSLDKRFSGALEATSAGEMLASGDGARSGAYVALEKVSGRLDGHAGSFVLMHRAVMFRGSPQDWSVTVVPDSATGALEGLTGSMTIRIEGGQHYYEFEYALPAR
jgi:hypothetical protein